MSETVDEFDKLLHEKIKSVQKVQTHWVEITSVNWDEKTCEVQGISDELPFYNVSLGVGSVFVKPLVGCTALIGIIEKDDTSTFLIEAEEVESIEINVNGDSQKFSIDQDGFLLKKENETLKALMVDLIEAIKQMVFTTNMGPTIKLVNEPQFTEIENRFKDFLKDS